MKKPTILIIITVLFYGFSFGQSLNGEHEIEHLMEDKSLAQFELDLNLSDEQKFEPNLMLFIESKYQEFYQLIVSDLNDAGTGLNVNQRYSDLVLEVTSKMSKIPFSNVNQNSVKAVNGPCVNMDFESGDFTGWTLTRGDVNGGSPYSFVNEVPQAPGTYHTITGAGTDPVTGISTVNPDGGTFSVRLGDGPGVGARAAKMSQTFLVDASNSIFTYSYAVIFQSPVGHALNQQPYFAVRVFDEFGNNVSCGQYSVIADEASAADYQSVVNGMTTTLYKDWETVFANLTPYIGQNVTVEFSTGDCSLSGHYGYAYVDASCMTGDIMASNSLVCTGDSAVLDAPDGADSYIWNTGDTTEAITIYNGGFYNVTMVPVQGAACAIDININIGDSHSPVTDFSTNNVICLNDTATFLDASTVNNPGIIDSYQWDFGDGNVSIAGVGNISGAANSFGTVLNPSHIYTAAGTYTATLTVTTVDGCTDVHSVLIIVNSPPTVNAGTDQGACDGSLINLTATGAVSYNWNFGVVTNGNPFQSICWFIGLCCYWN